MTRHYEREAGEYIQARRGELGMTQAELARLAHTTARTIRNAEQSGSRLSPKLRAKVEQVLGWEPGALTTVYTRGKRPTVGGRDLPVDPELAALINNPALDDRQRDALISRLQRLQRELARDAREMYGLNVTPAAE